MKKVDRAAKLSSCKFWALLAALVTAVLTATGACVAYMLAEVLADSKRKDGDKVKE